MDSIDFGMEAILEYQGMIYYGHTLYMTDSFIAVKADMAEWPLVFDRETMQQLYLDHRDGEVRADPHGAVLCELPIGESVH